MNRKICILLTFFLLLAALVPLAAASTIIDQYAYINDSGNAGLEHVYPSGDATTSAVGQVFASPTHPYLDSVVFYARRYGAPTGYLTAYLYSVSGAYGSTTTCVGSPVATSTTFIDVSTLTTGSGHNVLTFQFNGTYHMTAEYYAIILLPYNGTNWNNDNKILVSLDLSSPSHAGNVAYYHTGLWKADDTIDLSFVVYGSTDASSTPTPPPAGTNEFWNNGVGAQIFGFLPTLTSLIVVLMAAFLGYKFAGPWGFMAGLNLGYVVSIFFNLLPLWGMIALLVVDGLLLFGKVGFRA